MERMRARPHENECVLMWGAHALGGCEVRQQLACGGKGRWSGGGRGGRGGRGERRSAEDDQLGAKHLAEYVLVVVEVQRGDCPSAPKPDSRPSQRLGRVRVTRNLEDLLPDMVAWDYGIGEAAMQWPWCECNGDAWAAGLFHACA